jgi:hyaluronoglucosaminidase
MKRIRRLAAVPVALAVAVALSVGGAAASAASASTVSASTVSASTSTGVPAVWPTPQQETVRPGVIQLPGTVTEVRGSGTDPDALSALASVLRSDGVRKIVTVTAGNPVPPGPLTIYVGTPTDDPDVVMALKELSAPSPTGLPSGGYVLAAGSGDLVLAGADATGTFYAVQTLRQLITRRAVHDVVIKDWPSIPVRGVIEGFYGPSWSDAEIASQLTYYGRNKLNTFVYSAKGDPYLRADWQDLYPASELSSLTTLVSDASAEHVNFVYALSPGLSICYSDPTDLAELEAKDQQLWDAGVRQFALFFDDVGSGFNCTADSTEFGSSADPLAAAQAYLLNEFVTGFIDTHPGADELITTPTDYSGDAESAYREVWKASLDSDVLVYWTGVGVIPQTITAAQAEETAAEFGHQIVVWDNYPVNDYTPTRLFLGPLTGRAADLGTAVAGFTANPMQEPAASEIPLFTDADYTWNSTAYDNAPDAAWTAGIDAYGGPAAGALRLFAADNQSTPYIGTLPEAPELAADISAFWTAYNTSSPGLGAAAAKLIADWNQIAGAATAIERLLPHRDFISEAGQWLAKFHDYGVAGAAAVRYVLGAKDGTELSKDYVRASAIPEVVGEGVFENFLLTADPALFSVDVRLYAADSADDQAALAAASAAGLPASQVTESFATAWDQTSSGEYLVIAVGGPADDALYFNQCGWTAPDGLAGGSTPFYYASSALNTLPPVDEYENAAGETAADTATLAADLAYYAVHGAYPAGATPPAAAAPAAVCAGQSG